MESSVFNLQLQKNDLQSKIIVGLERVSGAFRALLRDYAKQVGLSPIQIQVLIFIKYHAQSLCTVSYLAREFDVTKPTVSDVVKVLVEKGLISKVRGKSDSRSYMVTLTEGGEEMTKSVEDFALPMKQLISGLALNEQESLFQILNSLLYSLNQTGVIATQRNCFGCRNYEKNQNGHYCHFFISALTQNEIRLDCPEFNKRA